MSVNALSWYYIPDFPEAGSTVSMPGEEWHHCYHVLRMAKDDTLIVFDGKGRCYLGVIRESSKHVGQIDLIRELTAEFHVDRSYKTSIAFAPTKNIDRTEFAVEKLVELGVDEIIFLDCDHAERTRIRMDRMEKIVLSAAKQSRKATLPGLQELIAPNILITETRHHKPDTMIFCCHLDNTSTPLSKNYSGGKDVLMLIGPEGGFTNEETEQMMMRGAQMITLGPFRLRVETAAITACHSVHIINDLKHNL